MVDMASGARLGAVVAVAFGVSLVVPAGVATADAPDDSRPSSSAEPAAALHHDPARQAGRARASAQRRMPDAAAAGSGHRRATSETPAFAPLPEPAAGAEPAPSPRAPLPTAVVDATVGGDVSTSPVPGIAPLPAAVAVAPSASVVPASVSPPTAVSAASPPAPQPIAAPASALTASTPAAEIGRLLDTVGNWLTGLPATDLLSGALLLTRRTLIPGGGSPSCGSTCTGEPLSNEPGSGQVLTVTNRVDGAPGSLRDVLGKAASGDVIRFAPLLRHATLKITEGELDVNVSVRIEGTQQTLDANGDSRIMRLDEPGTSIGLSGLTFTGGAAPGDPFQATMGGAILADGVVLDISRSRFTKNSAVSSQPADPANSFMQAGLGGAIAAFNSTISISDSEFNGNVAAGADNDAQQQASSGLGGAIFAGDSTVVLLRTVFTRNAATGGSGVAPIAEFPTSDGGWGAGGAVFSQGGPVSAANVTFRRNSATGGKGLNGSASNPYGNDVGAGGRASAGALWVQGRGLAGGDPVPLELNRVTFARNTATGGAAGAQGTAFLAGQQGGRAIGGALATVDWVDVSLDNVTLADNVATGGGAGPNAPEAGPNTGTGGVGQGGGAFLESPASLQATRLSVRHNTAQGGKGSDSPPDSGTEAGEGGFAYGGGILLINNTAGLGPPVVITVGIRQTDVVGNRAVGGQGGEGPLPAEGLGAGGIAQGGGMDMISAFQSDLVGVRFVGNSAIAGQGKPAFGGGLATPFGGSEGGLEARLLIQNSVFRDNSAVGGKDAANDVYRETTGGAFDNNGAGTVVSGTRFVHNTALGGDDTGSGHAGSALGGAVYSGGQNPSITFSNNTFAWNSALGGRRVVPGESTNEASSGEAHGGALFSATGTITVNGGAFGHNQATVRVKGADRPAVGGAIEAKEPGAGYTNDLNTIGVRFASNVARSMTGISAGGAVAFDGTAFTDNGSAFRFNLARSGLANGAALGGALLIGQTSQLAGTTVTFNRATAAQGYGGGLALPHGPDVLTQVQTAVRRNSATTAGDDIWWPAGP